MRKSIRLTVLACALALALAVTALAAAAYEPVMGIFQGNYKPGGAGAVTVVVFQDPGDDATARIVIYTAPGYTVTLGQAPGTTIGTVLAHVQLLQTGSTNLFTLTGAVKVENPATFATVAAQCAPGPAPEAVWSLNAALPGQPPNVIPIFVSHTVGAEAAFSSAKLTVCFRNPALQQPQGSGGIKFVDATFTVRGVFRNPTNAGTPVWRSLFTPWAGSNPVPNAAGTREAQAIVPMPYSVTLRRVRARRGFFRVAGSVNRAGARPSGLQVRLYRIIRGKNGISFRQLGRSTRTRRGGTFAFTRRLPRRTTFVLVQRVPTAGPCVSPTVASCVAAIESNAVSRVIRIAPAKKRRR